jgi:hypothetical protein
MAGLAAATPLKRLFPKNGPSADLEVQTSPRVEVSLSAPPFRAWLFFTAEHAATWCAGASNAAPCAAAGLAS